MFKGLALVYWGYAGRGIQDVRQAQQLPHSVSQA